MATTKTQVHIRTTCERCEGKTHVPVGEVTDHLNRTFIRYIPCGYCQGTGFQPHWIDLTEFLENLYPEECNCVLPEHSCKVCQKTARTVYGGDELPY